MDMRVAESLIGRRSPAVLAAIIGGVALLLAAIGTYGVLSYAIVQRRREIGIRIALGAARSSALGLVMKQGLQLTIMGTLVGLAGAFGLSRLIASLLYGVRPTDPATMAAVIMTITFAAAVASALPAWRASRLDPNTALTETDQGGVGSIRNAAGDQGRGVAELDRLGRGEMSASARS